MSYRTNRKTGGVFRTRDYTPSEIESQARRFVCPRCEAVVGKDVPPATAQFYARETGHEVPGTPIASFISREELNEHIRMMHPGQRFPTTAQRRLGYGVPQINIIQENATQRRRRSKPKTEGERVDEFYETREPESTQESMEQAEANTEPETVTEGESEGDDGTGFTDDDDQVFDGDGGLI